MSDVAITNQLPPRTTSSTRWPRKWATLGGRSTSTSTSVIATNDAESSEPPLKTNGHHRHSTSLLRKASTISRNDDPAAMPDDPSSPSSLKKSRSLMNVLRAKLNSPAVIRRFRSKSRENSKQTVTEVNGHSADEPREVKPSNGEDTAATRKSRKRDPSPMRRLANRISQLTRHQSATAYERQKKSPTKSMTNDEIAKPSTPAPNKDKVDHINACYDEIRAKYFKNNNTSIPPSAAHDDVNNRSAGTTSMNGSLLSNGFSNGIERVTTPTVPDDPLLQARRQANLKLNCLLSGYTLTTPFSVHEKSFGRNDLFKFNHYYDVGKRKYDWNSANTSSRVFSSMRTRPISKSIDSFRPTNVTEDEVPIPLERMNVVDHDRLVRADKHPEDVSRVLPSDDELVLRRDNDSNELEPKRSSGDVKPAVLADNETFATTTISEDSEKNNTIAPSRATAERDDEFEQNFLRAVDRALGVASKDDKDAVDAPKEEDTPQLNLEQMTERALSSIQNLPAIANDESTSDKQELHENVDLLASSADIQPATEEIPTIHIQEELEARPADEQPVVIDEEKHVELPSTATIIDETPDEPSPDPQPAITIEEVHTAPTIVTEEKTIDEPANIIETIDEPPAVTAEPPVFEQWTPIVEKEDDVTIDEQPPTIIEETPVPTVEDKLEQPIITEEHEQSTVNEALPISADEAHVEPTVTEQQPATSIIDAPNEPSIVPEEIPAEQSTNGHDEHDEIASVMNDLLQKTEDSFAQECKNGQTFLAKLDDEENTIKSKASAYHDLLAVDDQRLTEDVRTDINAVIGEVNLLLRGKLKQFRGLCQANVTKSTAGEPIPLDSDLEGFWDITYPLIDKVKEKFGKLDARKAKQWAHIEEYDPNDINNRPRVIDDRLKQLQPQQNKASKTPPTKSANDDLKKLIQERRKAAASTANQNHDVEIFVAPK